MSWDDPNNRPTLLANHRQNHGVDWGYMLVFGLIPLLIAWWLTNRTEQLVNAMWAAEHTPAPAIPGQPDAIPDGTPNPAAEAAVRARLAAVAQTQRKMHAEEEAALERLLTAGPPETWIVDPELKAEVLAQVRVVSPATYQRWQDALAAQYPGWRLSSADSEAIQRAALAYIADDRARNGEQFDQALEGLLQWGPPDQWPIAPELRAELIESIRTSSPGFYHRWLHELAARYPDWD